MSEKMGREGSFFLLWTHKVMSLAHMLHLHMAYLTNIQNVVYRLIKMDFIHGTPRGTAIRLNSQGFQSQEGLC